MNALARVWIATVIALAAGTAYGLSPHAVQWRPWEMLLEADEPLPNPRTFELLVSFTGPHNERYIVPTFWDGGRRWLVRFAPVAAGRWTYSTPCPDQPNAGLHCRSGVLDVAPAGDNANPIFRHGGFLKVSSNRRYLTYSDGTPFFWLGDTWWFCASDLCPFDGSSNSAIPSMFKKLVDVRKQQRFSVAQIAFVGPGSGAERSVRGPLAGNAESVAYWRNVDRYFGYANEAGLVLVVGIGFHSSIDASSLEDLKALWRYVIARYGAYAATWLILGEYNLLNVPERVQKSLELGRYIKALDPYRRAMTIHPSRYDDDQRQAWEESWLDFIMLQGSHDDALPPVRLYTETYARNAIKPLLEAESSYEGIRGFSAARVRMAAYRAIQSGSFGYAYGAHGLWYPTQNSEDKTFQSEWGPSLPWWEALDLPGAAQMTILRNIYERLEWWKLEPRPNAVLTLQLASDDQRILARAEEDKIFVLYFPGARPGDSKPGLLGTDPNADYLATWINPRNGSEAALAQPLRSDGRFLSLPAAPDGADWLLILRKAAAKGRKD